MALINSKDTYLFYKYKIKEIYLLFSDGSYKVENERMNGLTTSEDYVGNLYPTIRLDLALEQSIYYRIVKDKDNVQVRLNLQKFYRKNTDDEKSMYSNHLSETFQLLLDDDDDNMAKKAQTLEYPEGDTGEMNSVTMDVQLYLFKAGIIRTNRESFEVCLKEATVSTALAYILTKMGASKILLSKIDNTTVYPYIIIPTMKLSKALAYLDSYYGIHNTGSIIFFGITRSYIIRYCAFSEAFESGEQDLVSIIVPQTGSSLTDNICQLIKKDGGGKIYVIADPNIETKTEDVSAKVLSSEEITLVQNESSTIAAKSSSKNSEVKLVKGENPFYTSVYNTQMRSNESVVNATFKDCDASIFTPNKKYQFIFEDNGLSSKYKGYYCLTSKDTGYVKDGENFTVGINCEFRRIPG